MDFIFNQIIKKIKKSEFVQEQEYLYIDDEIKIDDIKKNDDEPKKEHVKSKMDELENIIETISLI
jgi:hypothetical protein